MASSRGESGVGRKLRASGREEGVAREWVEILSAKCGIYMLSTVSGRDG